MIVSKFLQKFNQTFQGFKIYWYNFLVPQSWRSQMRKHEQMAELESMCRLQQSTKTKIETFV